MSPSDPTTWRGMPVRGAHDEALGQVDAIYFHDSTGRAAWVAVLGDGPSAALVPLDLADVDGDTLHVPYSGAQLAAAPPHNPAVRLAPADEQTLYRHYGLTPDLERTPPTEPATADPKHEMVRSREELRIERVVQPRARFRWVRHIVTENRTITVPLRREELRLEPMPLTAPDVDSADLPARLGGDELVEDVQDIVLLGEEAVVITRTVPVERVRLVRRIVTDRQWVTGELRAEQVELDRPGDERDGDLPPQPSS